MLGMEVTHLVRRLDDARGASGWRWLALSPFPLYLLAAGAAGSSVGDLVLGLPSSLALVLIVGCASTAVCRTVNAASLATKSKSQRRVIDPVDPPIDP